MMNRGVQLKGACFNRRALVIAQARENNPVFSLTTLTRHQKVDTKGPLSPERRVIMYPALKPPAPPSKPFVAKGPYHLREDIRWHDHDEIMIYRPAGPATASFFDYLRDTPDAEVCAFFRGILSDLSGKGIYDIHLTIHHSRRGSTWSIEVVFNLTDHLPGALKVHNCMSCRLGASLAEGVFGEADPAAPTSTDSLIEERAGMRYWIDGKARNVIVATPVRHCENFDQMTDSELVEMWKGMRRVMTDLNVPDYRRLVINVGKYQTHAHLHLKAYIPSEDFAAAVESDTWQRRGLSDKYRLIKGWIERLERPGY